MKLLYETKFEADELAIAQGALLLTYHTPPDNPEASMSWIACAMEYSNKAKNNPLSLNDPKRKSLLRRVDWAIISRDRILSLGRHRSPLLSIDVIRMYPVTCADFEDEIWHSRVHSPDTKRVLIRVFQAQCRLAIVLTDVASLSFSTGMDVPNLSSDQYFDLLTEIRLVSIALSSWKSDTQSQLTYEEQNQHQSIKVFANLTLMYYQ